MAVVAVVAKRVTRVAPTTRPDLTGQKKTDPVRVLASFFKVDPWACPIKSYRCTALLILESVTPSDRPRSKNVGLNPGWRVAPNEFLYFSPYFSTVSNTFSVVDFRTRIELAIKKARTEI